MRDPKKSLSTKPFNLARKKMQEKASSMIKEAAVPKDGIWYWLYLKPEWKLFTWAFPVREEKNVNHIDMWPEMCRKILAPHYKWNAGQLKEALSLPYSMPRGRVTAEKFEEGPSSVRYFFIRHGSDAPASRSINEVVEEFGLSLHLMNGMAELIHDPEETTVSEEKLKMTDLIGLDWIEK